MYIKPSVTSRYLVVNFTGVERAHEKYLKLKGLCLDALDWLKRHDCDRNNYLDLERWVHGAGGFTRPHTPYYVTLTTYEWKILTRGLRHDEGSNAAYCWVRYYARWEYDDTPTTRFGTRI